jgi:hypothetical protein
MSRNLDQYLPKIRCMQEITAEPTSLSAFLPQTISIARPIA